jgi:hypothetical protein
MRGFVQFCAITALLALIAAAAPVPWYPTDREIYQDIGRSRGIAPDCSSLHCTRVLVPWLLEGLPGPSDVKWKTYAVLANAGGAVALGRLSAIVGLSTRAVALAPWIAAVGFGPLFTLFDPYSSDPLMYLVGPVLFLLLLRDRLAIGGMVATVGVLAKEFAAVPLWIFCWYEALQRRWGAAARAFVMALFATTAWLSVHLSLVAGFNYTYSDSPSVDLLGGGYLGWWVSKLGTERAVAVFASACGTMLVLAAAGLAQAPRTLRLLALATFPATVLFVYVQQPDRALWNFNFVFVPAAALVIERLPRLWPWAFVVAYGLANARVGAQLPFVPRAAFAVSAALFLALYAIARGRKAVAPALASETARTA